MTADPVAGYSRAAGELARSYLAIDPAELYRPVAAWLPPMPARLLDVGAGSGRDAAWFGALGYAVTAVEPAGTLMEEGRRMRGGRDAFGVIEDRLPLLAEVTGQFDAITVTAVWHHLPPAQRPEAMRTLAAHLRTGGVLILSLRHGPIPVTRPGFETDPEEVRRDAEAAGLGLVAAFARHSVHAAGRQARVHWSWLVLVKF